jgi:hypothetical protein
MPGSATGGPRGPEVGTGTEVDRQHVNRNMTKKPSLCAALLVLAVLPAGCGRPQDTAPGVATAEFSPDTTRVPLGSPLEVTYRWRVAADARIEGDYRALVHFVDADGRLMWTDDHDPPVPPAEWLPGQTIEYHRLIWVPVYPYIGEAAVRMGLYTPGTGARLPLTGEHAGQRAYVVERLRMLPQSENIFLIHRDGWHGVEAPADNPAEEWQWTSGQAVLAFRNPRRDVMLYLELDGRPDFFPRPPQVALEIGGSEIERLIVESPERVLHRIPITAAQLGQTDLVELRLVVDQTFVPARQPAAVPDADGRELGVRIFRAFIR